MTPSRSRKSSSRRSSILKPPKPRQSLQNLNDNSSFNENSPATMLKFKRRVSFAEKKHVKEFCDSVEQGTVWDTTYEEHDLSNLKVSNTSNQETQNVQVVDKENIVHCNQENRMQFVSNVMTEKDLHVHNYNLRSRDSLLHQTEMLVDSNNLNATSVQDIHMDFTEVVCHTIHRDTNYIQNSKSEEILQNASMELTQPICSSVNMLQNFQQEQNIQKLNFQHKLNKFNVTAVDQHASMELTVAVPSIIKPFDNADEANSSVYSENNTTKRFDNISMEITTPVPAVSAVQHRLQQPFDNISMEITTPVLSVSPVLHSLQQPVTTTEIGTCDPDLMTPVCNKTSIFHNASMEITNAVKTKADTDTHCQFDEFGRPIVMQKINSKRDNEKTKVLNISMEMTEAVPINVHFVAKSQEGKETSCKITDASVENDLRKVRPYLACYTTSINLHKTNVYDNEAMEFTEAIRTSPIAIEDKASPNRDKTNMYDNEAMEFTEAVRTSFKAIEDKTSPNRDKTNMYDNEAMEFTEAVRTSFKAIEDKTLPNRDKTNMYDNEAMEFTEAVTVSPKNNLTNTEHVRNSSPSPWNNDGTDDSMNLVTNETIPSQNNSMTITNIVPLSGIKDHKSDVNNLELIKTILNPNMSMDITEDAVGSQCCFSIKNPITNSTCAKESVFLENKSKNSSDTNVGQDNVLKDITNVVVGSSSEPDLITDKEMQTADDFSQCVKNIVTKTSGLSELESSVSNACSIGLLGSDQQDVDVLTPKENIREKTYILHSPVVCDPSNSVISEINQKECLSRKQLQNVISNPRRTYIIQPLQIDDSRSKEDNKTSDDTDNEIKNDTSCYTLSGNTSCTKNNLSNTDNIQNNNEECLTEEDTVLFSNGSLEGLNSITPPSFVCLEDSSDSDTPVDVDVEENYNSSNRSSGSIEQKSDSNNISDIPQETSEVNEEEADIRTDKVDDDCSRVDLMPSLESHSFPESKNESIELDPFSSLMNKLKVCAQSDKIIWEVYHENIERNLVVIGFISSSLLIVIYLKDDYDAVGDQLVKEIKVYSRLANDADVLISIVHRIIMEKLDAQVLTDLCKNCEDIFSILDNISKEVKLAMDFMFDVERIRDINLMEITRDSISFVAFAKRKDIILRVTIDIKPFHKIESKDISVHCRLGSVREEDIKGLIRNIKRDHKFLRRYINDVNDYIYLMEESANVIKR